MTSAVDVAGKLDMGVRRAGDDACADTKETGILLQVDIIGELEVSVGEELLRHGGDARQGDEVFLGLEQIRTGLGALALVRDRRYLDGQHSQSDIGVDEADGIGTECFLDLEGIAGDGRVGSLVGQLAFDHILDGGGTEQSELRVLAHLVERALGVEDEGTGAQLGSLGVVHTLKARIGTGSEGPYCGVEALGTCG